jgi:hypothetical protein
MKKKWFVSSLITLALLGSFFIGQQFSLEVAARSSTLWRSLQLVTGQITCYFIKDNGDQQKGITKSYTVYTAGAAANSVNVDSPHYAANTISFVAASNLIMDSANGLATVLLGDTIRIRGTGSNESVFTVTVAGGAANVTVDGPVVTEAAGNYITISKRASHSNNIVLDNNTGLIWARYVQTGKIGPASDGKLNWYNATKCYTLHPAAADLATVAGNILRVTGSDESSRYFAGQVLVCSGFANAVNLLPGLVVVSVSFTGGNTDIVVNPGNQTLIAEAAAGSRDIKIVCQSVFSYAAAVNVAGLGGYSDWRMPNKFELPTLLKLEAPTAYPDSTAFPTWPAIAYDYWTSTTKVIATTEAYCYTFSTGLATSGLKTGTNMWILVRGG